MMSEIKNLGRTRIPLHGRTGFLCALMLLADLSASGHGAQSVSLGWDRSADTNVAGYYLYYGTTNGNYSSRVDVGSNTTATITGLATRSVTYYFAATSHDASGMESPLSNQASFTTSSNAGPSLSPVPGFSTNVNSLVILTSTASDPDTIPNKKLTYSLDPGAPSTMQINTNTGKVTWVPRLEHAGTTNQVTVRVTDNSAQGLYSTSTFTLGVSNAVQVNLGSAIVAVGQTGSVQLTVVSSTAITNLTFVLDAPSNRLSNVTVQSLMPSVATVSQQTAGAAHSTVTINAVPGQSLQGTQVVAQVNFTATAGQSTMDVNLTASNVTAKDANGQTVPKGFGSMGDLVLVGAQAWVKSLPPTNGHQTLILFGPAGKSFQVQSSASTTSTNWTPVVTSSVLTSSLTQTFPNVAIGGSLLFYRTLGL
jgi:hypothetical protein